MRAPALVGIALVSIAGCAGHAASRTPVGPTVLLAERTGAGARYLGSESCRGCHPEEYARWQATGHARDFAGLPASDRAAPSCLRCHVTGFADPLGFDGAGTAGLAAVGCEACHGAGADHGLSRLPGLVPTATGGACPPCEVNRICRLCHTPEHSAGFDLARSLERVSCGRGASESR